VDGVGMETAEMGMGTGLMGMGTNWWGWGEKLVPMQLSK